MAVASARHGRIAGVTDLLAAAAITFVVVLLVELPDKTLVATLVLAARYRPRPVLLGVAAAFAVQSVIAVAAGGMLHLLPHRAVEMAVAVLFAIGAVLLLREGFGAADEVDLDERAARAAASFPRIVLTSFGVIFAAEWGDASQLATAALAARFGRPVAVGLGAWVALTVVAAIAVVAGRVIVRRAPVRMVHRVARVLFALFAVIAAAGAVRG
ncbi:MAG: hypothetical protein DLM58_19485 [Pseudonocardiales bacterium]|nr:MAG: hypothetical protein DLM58_19485 [Pseudonocardiales bacterium]